MRDFRIQTIDTGETTIFACSAGSGPPLLLLHGFPHTHLMWRDIAPRLARNFTVVCADLRGYGQSGCPASATDHAPEGPLALWRAWADDVTGQAIDGGHFSRKLHRNIPPSGWLLSSGDRPSPAAAEYAFLVNAAAPSKGTGRLSCGRMRC